MKVVAAAHPVVEAALTTENEPDAATHPLRVPHDIEAEHTGRALGRDQERRQNLDRGRLAGAVRSENAEQLTFVDRKRKLVEGNDLFPSASEHACGSTKCPPYVLEFNRRHS